MTHTLRLHATQVESIFWQDKAIALFWLGLYSLAASLGCHMHDASLHVFCALAGLRAYRSSSNGS